MFRAIATFELKYHLRTPLFWILAGVYVLAAFGIVTTDAIALGGATGAVRPDAPFVIMQLLLMLSILGMLPATAFVANAVHRDFEHGVDALFFSSPVSKWQYLGGRFIGSVGVTVLVYAGVVVAMIAGNAVQAGSFVLGPYVFSMVTLVVPNLVLLGAIFFAVTVLTRSLLATYASVVAFVVTWDVATGLLENLDNERLAAILDPFGLNAFSIATRYWTAADKNIRLLSLDGVFLANRLLWMAIALAIFALAYSRFRKESRHPARPRQQADIAGEMPALQLPVVHQSFRPFKQYAALTARETLTIFSGIAFLVMLVLAIAGIAGNGTLDSRFGTSFHPVTQRMVSAIFDVFTFVGVLIAAFSAGEIIWRERSLKMHMLQDALPVPTWAIWASKATALVLALAAAIAVATAASIIIQLLLGHTTLELALYAKGVFLQLGAWLLLIAGLSFVMQVFINQKFAGFLGVVAWFVLMLVLPAIGFEHPLYLFAGLPSFSYSDMNGFGHFAEPLFWFTAYWLLLIGALMAVAHLLWVRGTDGGLAQRLRIARRRFEKPVATTIALCLIAFVATGCWIYYNTNVLNHYRTSEESEQLKADYERHYKQHEYIPQPRITAVQADVDVFPERRAVAVRGTYTLVNNTQTPIHDLHIMADDDLDSTVQIPGAILKSADKRLGYWIYTLSQPLAPGAAVRMTFRTAWAARGFASGTSNVEILENGTFFNSAGYFPHIGYHDLLELEDNGARRRHGLAPVDRMRPPGDVRSRMNNLITRDSDWLEFDTTVSTSADQIAIAPGALQGQWTANGRRYFRYKTRSPTIGVWAYLSARYEVQRESLDGVDVEVYYDEKHAYNIDSMINAVKKSLDYNTRSFGPYQHEQIRIVEFPGYRRFAQSHAGTIAFSEASGFIADVRDRRDVDYVFYITAHEVAHQWWAHQLIGANVQGSSMLTETLAQYSALMVMEKEYGLATMQKFLRYELDRYLRGRAGEAIAEMPLVLVENQNYLHYSKGSLVMYALRDAVGEAAVNRGLARFLRDYAYSRPPYTTARELVRYLRAEAGPQHDELITDLFERVVLYDNAVREVSATRRDDGKYVVRLTVASTKLRSDKPIPVNDLVDIAVFGENEKLLFHEKRHITQPVETFEVIVGEKPERARIDPFSKLIDLNPRDNVKAI